MAAQSSQTIRTIGALSKYEAGNRAEKESKKLPLESMPIGLVVLSESLLISLLFKSAES
jgi:hypothetical protein